MSHHLHEFMTGKQSERWQRQDRQILRFTIGCVMGLLIFGAVSFYIWP